MQPGIDSCSEKNNLLKYELEMSYMQCVCIVPTTNQDHQTEDPIKSILTSTNHV